MRSLIKPFVVLGITAGLMLSTASISHLSAADSSWKPNKPVNLIVPWGAGGATDGVSRQTAMVLEKFLDQKIVIVNQPGASGSVGTKEPKDAAWLAAKGHVVDRLHVTDVAAKDALLDREVLLHAAHFDEAVDGLWRGCCQCAVSYL